MAKQTEETPLFPVLPENLSELSDDELGELLQKHETAADLVDKEDEEYTQGLSADEILEAYEAGVEQIEAIRAEQELRVAAQQEYLAKKNELAERRKVTLEAEGEAEGEGEDEGEGERRGRGRRGRGRGPPPRPQPRARHSPTSQKRPKRPRKR